MSLLVDLFIVNSKVQREYNINKNASFDYQSQKWKKKTNQYCFEGHMI